MAVLQLVVGCLLYSFILSSDVVIFPVQNGAGQTRTEIPVGRQRFFGADTWPGSPNPLSHKIVPTGLRFAVAGICYLSSGCAFTKCRRGHQRLSGGSLFWLLGWGCRLPGRRLLMECCSFPEWFGRDFPRWSQNCGYSSFLLDNCWCRGAVTQLWPSCWGNFRWGKPRWSPVVVMLYRSPCRKIRTRQNTRRRVFWTLVEIVDFSSVFWAVVFDYVTLYWIDDIFVPLDISRNICWARWPKRIDGTIVKCVFALWKASVVLPGRSRHLAIQYVILLSIYWSTYLKRKCNGQVECQCVFAASDFVCDAKMRSKWPNKIDALDASVFPTLVFQGCSSLQRNHMQSFQ